MGYLYETHLHTSWASKCGKSGGDEYLPWYKERSYDGIFVTDHFYKGNTCVPKELPWADWVKGYCDAWRRTKEAAAAYGLKVFFGWETTYKGEDFLIYGLDEAWLLAHPDIILWDQREQYEQVHAAGGLVVQAHPFRERYYQSEIKLHPYHADAWEVGNLGNEAYMDALAMKFAAEHGLKMTCGDDIHSTARLIAGKPLYAMETEQPLNSEKDYVAMILSGKGWRNLVPEERFTEDRRNPWFPVQLFDRDHEPHTLPNEFFPGAESAEDPKAVKAREDAKKLAQAAEQAALK